MPAIDLDVFYASRIYVGSSDLVWSFMGHSVNFWEVDIVEDLWSSEGFMIVVMGLLSTSDKVVTDLTRSLESL